MNDFSMARRREVARASALEIAMIGAFDRQRVRRQAVERLGIQAERVYVHASGKHVRRRRSGYHDDIRGGIDLTHDRRRVVGALHIDRRARRN